MRALEDELADPAAWATQYESAKSEARHTAAGAPSRRPTRAWRRSWTELRQALLHRLSCDAGL